MEFDKTLQIGNIKYIENICNRIFNKHQIRKDNFLDTLIANNITWHCGGMNIDACRVPISKADINMLNAKASKNPTTNYSDTDTRVYGKYAEDKASPANEQGRFPANIILDEGMAKELDEQTGQMKSKRSSRGIGFSDSNIFGSGNKTFDTVR